MRKVLSIFLLTTLLSSISPVFSQEISEGEAQALLEKTQYNKKRGNLEGALGYGLLGLDQAEYLGDENLIFEFRSILGDIYLSKKDYKRSINYFLGIVLSAKRTGEQSQLAQGYYYLADTYTRMGAYNKASDYYYQVSVIYDKTGFKQGKASAIESLGINYVTSNQTEKAVDTYERLLKIAVVDKLYSYVGKAQEQLFTQYMILGNTEEAIKYGVLYYERIKDRGNNDRIAEAADLLAGQYILAEDDKNALKYANIAVLKNPNAVNYKENQAVALAMNNEYQKSMSTFDDAIAKNEKLRKMSDVAELYNRKAEVANQKADFKTSLNALEKAEEIAVSKNSKEILLDTYKFYADMYKRKGSTTQYEEYLKMYEAVKLQVGNNDTMRSKVSASRENLAESFEQEARAQISSSENQKLAKERERLKSEQKIKELELLEQKSKLQEVTMQQIELEAQKAKQEVVIVEQAARAKLNQEQLDRLQLEAEMTRLSEAERQKELDILQKESQILQQQKEFEAKQAKQAKILQYIIITAAITILTILAIAFYRTYNTGKTIQEQNQNLAEQQKTILNRNIQLKKSSEAMLAMNNKLKKAHVNLKVLLKKEQSTREELEKANKEIKNTQVHLVQAEKMSSLGLLTAGIAHEINNPINFVSSGAQSLLRNFEELKGYIENYQKVLSLDDIEQIRKYRSILAEDEDNLNDLQSSSEELLADVNYGISRITEIVNGLRTFSRHDEAEVKDADINESFDSALLILKNKYKNKAEIVKNMDETIPQIQCFPGQLNQVFVNLVNNALDAMEDDGTITITTKNLDEDFIEIRIQDTGSGMPDHVKDKIFDPFFTTKDIGKGTGLGLSISHGIIEKHNGTIEVESELGVGTTFIIRLPKKLELDEKVLENQLS
ncbi:ATP-binding protein [Reichenbachiella agarivorans]|uniref:histidine kinase n=1 Tax=Reichenbachiella agarivorans TaxID=2979464 RepID=A0ABY6CPW3_9BACT|nr:ATP-binding protein [Reichenbachiella agarivorans]UXP31478.1 ATP-binding protein [Reichenbachiella agarivorans]